jgi:hypothetical protein
MRLDALLRGVRAVRKRGKFTRRAANDFQIPFISAIYCTSVREAGIKGTSSTLTLNTGHI